MGLRTICAWCQRLIVDGDTIDGHCSHGLCRPCSAKMAFDEFRHQLALRLVGMPTAKVETMAEGYRRIRDRVVVLHHDLELMPPWDLEAIGTALRLQRCIWACRQELESRSEARYLAGGAL